MDSENPTEDGLRQKIKPRDRKPLTGQAWRDAFESLKRDAKEQAKNYPPGYSPTCERDGMCGSETTQDILRDVE